MDSVIRPITIIGSESIGTIDLSGTIMAFGTTFATALATSAIGCTAPLSCATATTSRTAPLTTAMAFTTVDSIPG